MAAWVIEFSDDAIRQLGQLRAADRRKLIESIETHLLHEANRPSRHRKLLRSNPTAAWELRAGDLRLFYNATDESRLVLVVMIGIKDRNRLIVEGREFAL